MKGTHDLRHGVLWKQILLFALPIAATALLVRHCTGGHGQGYFHF